VVAVLVGGIALVAGASSAASPEWTKLSSPAAAGQPYYQFYDAGIGGTTPPPDFVVAGTTSAGVTTVNIYCFSDQDRQTTNTPLNSSPIAVTGGGFSASVPAPHPANSQANCVLRAVPSDYTDINSSTGVNTGYVGSFAGPTFYVGLVESLTSGASTIAKIAEAQQQRGVVAVASPDLGQVYIQESTDDLAKFLVDFAGQEETLALLPANVQVPTPTRSEIVVDGHNGYFPGNLATLKTSASAQPPVSISAKRLSNGDLSFTDSEPISWCSGNAFPPSAGTCIVEKTGVSLRFTAVSSAQGAIVTVHDSFVATDSAAHSLSIEYLDTLPGEDSSQPGVMLPGQASFAVPTPGTTNTSLPAGPHTVFVTSDIHGADGSTDRQDDAVTYSGKPTVYFGTASGDTAFELRYTRHLAKHGVADLSFGVESGLSVASVKSLATTEQKALTEHLTITTPKSAAKVGTKVAVSGKITNPVNGLPTTVTVKSGSVHKTATVSSSGKWSVKLTLKKGKHTITATATDPSGKGLKAKVTAKVK
jgi:Glucodextranase, domain B